ncbi:unnamed protein product [Darwinula stevensoni]|uniref:Cyclin-like domain-containing protein n=1 Tax=Darwinula stevensoni TaxID=69355 RepID=A0A7R9AEJ5_9CRUS|nr:unnamed protein product [Darwinula stevensoni]CAG0902139.1 unnamed protein product [Darwinula stevensoni]
MTSRTGLLPALRRQNSENGIRTTRASAGLRLRGGLGPKGAFTDASNRPKPTARLGRPVANLGKQSLGVKPKVRSAMTKRGSVADQENRPVTEALETLTEEKSELEEAPIKPRVRAGDVSPISQSLKLLQEATGDPDSDDINDPQCLASYASDIYHYLWKKERDLAIQEDFLEGKGVKPQHREMLVNWLIQVQMDMRLCQETLYLGIFILDKYCSMEKVLQKSKYQLTGITSLFIASKVEEVGYIPIEDFAEMTDGAVTVSEMKSHEMRILHTIDFVVTRPHALHFLRRDSKVGQPLGLSPSYSMLTLEEENFEADVIKAMQ